MKSALTCNDRRPLDRGTLISRVVFLSAVLLALLSAGTSHLAGRYRLLLVAGELSCIPYKLVLVRMERPENISVARGQLLAFLPYGRLTEDLNRRLEAAAGGILVVKYVGGVAGDQIVIEHDHATVAGVNYGPLDLLDRLEAPPGFYDRNETIPVGELAMMGTEPRSFDARYWGTITVDEVVGVVYPIW